MTRDFEDLHDIGELGDRELRDLVVERLTATNAIDANDITVRAVDGVVRLEGRVGTDEERRIVDHVLSDSLGLQRYENNVLVDPIRRAESPVDVEDQITEEERSEGLLLGDRPVPLTTESEHLKEDLDSRLWGTSDVHRAIESATPWIPPEAPTPEGLEGPENTPGGEDR